MKFIILSLIIIIGLCSVSNAQTKLDDNLLKLDREYFDLVTVRSQLRANQDISYKDVEIQELRLEIWDHNAEVDIQQQKLIDKKNILTDKRQEIVQLENISQIIDRVDAKHKSIAKIRKDIEENLTGLGYKGIYVFACKMESSWTSKKDLRNMALKYITPLAVENTNGSFISSITELKKKEGGDDEFYQYIQDIIQGTCNVEADIIDNPNRKDGYYIFMSKINTLPLQKQDVSTQVSTEYGLPEQSIVFDAIKDKNGINALKDIGIPKEEVKKIKREIKTWKELIEKENERIRSIEHDFIIAGNKKIDAIYKEINELNLEFEQKSEKLKSILEQYTSTEYNVTQIDVSIYNAKIDIDNQIKNYERQILKIEENRLFADYQIMVTTSGDYFSVVAKETIDALEALTETYSRVENYVRIAELENDYYTKNIGNNQEYQRYFDKIWIFPEPGEGDYFRITIVVKYTLDEPGRDWRWWN